MQQKGTEMINYDDNDEPCSQDYDMDDISVYKEWRDTDLTVNRILNAEEEQDLFRYCL